MKTEADTVSQAMGLIAGDGALPLEIARAGRGRGARVHAVAFHHLTDPALESEVDSLAWLHLGEVDALVSTFRSAGVHQAVMAGKVTKTHLFDGDGPLRPDARALELLRGLKDRSDDSILLALGELLSSEGISLLPQANCVPHLLAREGCLGKLRPSERELEDLAFGWPIAKAIAGQDVGQCVVVKDRAVLAVEAIEGTDAAVLRAGELGGEGACVLKVAKPAQDPRFDVPVIGPGTLDVLTKARARVLAFEAGACIVLSARELALHADRAGIVLLGVAPSRIAEDG